MREDCDEIIRWVTIVNEDCISAYFVVIGLSHLS